MLSEWVWVCVRRDWCVGLHVHVDIDIFRLAFFFARSRFLQLSVPAYPPRLPPTAPASVHMHVPDPPLLMCPPYTHHAYTRAHVRAYSSSKPHAALGYTAR